MSRSVFEKLATVQMLDVAVPTTDGRELLLVRRTEPFADVQLWLERLELTLPPQPPRAYAPHRSCSGDFQGAPNDGSTTCLKKSPSCETRVKQTFVPKVDHTFVNRFVL
jgi:hypothetical protein